MFLHFSCSTKHEDHGFQGVWSCNLFHHEQICLCILYMFITGFNLFKNKGFENTTFNYTLGVHIFEVLMNIISCHGFIK